MKNILPYLVIAGLIFIGVFFYPKPLPPEQIITIERDTIRDTIRIHSTIYKPKITYQDTGSTEYLYHDVDTAEILKDYFISRFYADTILNDLRGFIVVMDTVYQNEIKARQTSLKLFTEAISTTTTIEQPEKKRLKLFYGLGVGGNLQQFGISPSVMIQNKKDNAFTFSYDLINKEYRVTGYWKIKF